MTDRGFCQPDAEEAASLAEKKKKQELDKEIEAVKKEYDEKQKLKREKRKKDGKEKDKDAKTKTKEDDEDKQDEKDKDEKVYDSYPKFRFFTNIRTRSKSCQSRKTNLKLNLAHASTI